MADQERKKESLDYKKLLSQIEEKSKKIERLQKALNDSVVEVKILKKANKILNKNINLKKYGSQKKS